MDPPPHGKKKETHYAFSLCGVPQPETGSPQKKKGGEPPISFGAFARLS